MTDRPDPSEHADPTGHDDEVRRLLADARLDEPMPAPVVARLDRVLADLAEEAGASPRPATGPSAGPSTGPTTGTVTSLAARRRRVAQLLVAAAAVVVVGIGVGEVLDGAGSDTASTTADQDTFLGSDGGSAGAEDEAAGDAAPEAASEPGDTTTRDESGKVWELRSSDFAAGVLTASRAYSPQALLDGRLERSAALVDSCLARAWGQGAFVPVTYDGTPGVLVFRRPLGDTRVADLFLCGTTEPLRSVTLPAP